MPTHIGTTQHYYLPYTAYLVRLWQDALDGPWRASAQSVQTGEIVRFGSQQALFEFIEAQLASNKLPHAPPQNLEPP